LRSKGVARIYDALVACALLVIGIAICINYLPQPIPENDVHQFSEIATTCLVFLDKDGTLSKAIYANDLSFFINFFKATLPSSMGFAVSIFNCKWELLSSFQSVPGLSDFGSVAYFLSGYNGTFDPRIVVLSIMR